MKNYLLIYTDWCIKQCIIIINLGFDFILYIRLIFLYFILIKLIDKINI
jgi:hypothetical protein